MTMKILVFLASILLFTTWASAQETYNCVGKSDQLVISSTGISYHSEDRTYLNLPVISQKPYEQWSSVIETSAGKSVEGLQPKASMTLFLKNQGEKVIEFELYMTNEGFGDLYPVFDCKGSAIEYGKAEQSVSPKSESSSGLE